MKPTILVVDDETDLVHLLRYNLEREGYNVLCAYDGSNACKLAEESTPDLMILDLMLPDSSGYDVCRHLKKSPATSKIPVIMLTARSAEYDRIKGFECGAEDYVVKPFSPKELVLRVKALLGRTRKDSPVVIRHGLLSIHPEAFRVLVNGEDVSLTQIEFNILMVLAKHPQMVLSREKLLDLVWKSDASEVFDRTVDAHVKRLRSKLGDARHMIETVRGVGYRFTLKHAAAVEKSVNQLSGTA